MPTCTLFAAQALLPEGWRAAVRIAVDEQGAIAAVETAASAEGAQRLAGPLLPGMPNLHSHAFQRAMAGLAERATDPDDSFWTWRQVMYGFVAAMTPDQAEAIARHLYIEMLKAGYTAVAEFHYLHHAAEGRPYADPAEMSERIVAAGAMAGIGLALLPVFYAHGGFGGRPPTEAQRRFIHDIDGYLGLVEGLRARHAGRPLLSLGTALHSLRAVAPAELAALGDAVPADAPLHIHIAEQQREVEDCLAWCGARPIDWLLDHAPVDGSWCLVHATHADEREVARVAASGAVAGLCPTTEANLGDGLFAAAPFLAAGGRLGIGSDSHVSVSVVEELRWLEYGQRLSARRRNRLARPDRPSVGGSLYTAALAGGAQALGQPIGAIAPGRRADLVVLDGDHPLFAGCSGDALLDRFLFGGSDRLVRDVMVGGAWVVRDGHHDGEREAAAPFAAATKQLIDAL